MVTETKHNVTEDSVVECRVQNSLGLQHDKAFIKVRPGKCFRARLDACRNLLENYAIVEMGHLAINFSTDAHGRLKNVVLFDV